MCAFGLALIAGTLNLAAPSSESAAKAARLAANLPRTRFRIVAAIAAFPLGGAQSRHDPALFLRLGDRESGASGGAIARRGNVHRGHTGIELVFLVIGRHIVP